jgi:transcriptional regulator with XRE-family HTH domain
MDYATKLRVLRVARGLSQLELGKRLGIANSYLSWIETGKVIPGGDLESQIRDALCWTERDDAALEMLAEPQAEGAMPA